MGENYPKPVIVVIVVRIVIVAIHGTRIILIVIERAAPQHLARMPDGT
jgi:hypothetical protein